MKVEGGKYVQRCLQLLKPSAPASRRQNSSDMHDKLQRAVHMQRREYEELKRCLWQVVVVDGNRARSRGGKGSLPREMPRLSVRSFPRGLPQCQWWPSRALNIAAEGGNGIHNTLKTCAMCFDGASSSNGCSRAGEATKNSPLPPTRWRTGHRVRQSSLLHSLAKSPRP